MKGFSTVNYFKYWIVVNDDYR